MKQSYMLLAAMPTTCTRLPIPHASPLHKCVCVHQCRQAGDKALLLFRLPLLLCTCPVFMAEYPVPMAEYTVPMAEYGYPRRPPSEGLVGT